MLWYYCKRIKRGGRILEQEMRRYRDKTVFLKKKMKNPRFPLLFPKKNKKVIFGNIIIKTLNSNSEFLCSPYNSSCLIIYTEYLHFNIINLSINKDIYHNSNHKRQKPQNQTTILLGINELYTTI